MRFLSYLSPGFPRSLFELLADAAGGDVSFDETLSGPAPGEDPFLDGTTDFGWICSTSYVDLSTRAPDPTIQLAGVAWVPDDPDANGRPIYFGDLVVRSDSSIRSFEDLAGLRIGCNDPVSLSGHHSLRFAMHDRGLDQDTFAELIFTGGHHTSLDMVMARDIDAAVIDSVVRTARARLEPRVGDLKVIERLGPWPVQPLVARSTLPTDQVDVVRRLILRAAERPDIKAQLDAAALSHLVEIGPEHYQDVEAAMTRVRRA